MQNVWAAIFFPGDPYISRTTVLDNSTDCFKKYLLNNTIEEGQQYIIYILFKFYYHLIKECDVGLHLLHRKTVAEAFWNAELENELREMGWTSYTFENIKSRETLMKKIDDIRATTIYKHEYCSDECKRRGIWLTWVIVIHIYIGCGSLFSIDGNWKICYPGTLHVEGAKGSGSFQRELELCGLMSQ